MLNDLLLKRGRHGHDRQPTIMRHSNVGIPVVTIWLESHIVTKPEDVAQVPHTLRPRITICPLDIPVHHGRECNLTLLIAEQNTPTISRRAIRAQSAHGLCRRFNSLTFLHTLRKNTEAKQTKRHRRQTRHAVSHRRVSLIIQKVVIVAPRGSCMRPERNR